MALLFSYGTLQEEGVQMATFGRRLEGAPDTLPSYEPALVPIPDPAEAARLGRTHNRNVRFTGNPDDGVTGTALEVSDAELAAADAYEARYDYRRIEVTLASRKRAWLYVHEDDKS